MNLKKLTVAAAFLAVGTAPFIGARAEAPARITAPSNENWIHFIDNTPGKALARKPVMEGKVDKTTIQRGRNRSDEIYVIKPSVLVPDGRVWVHTTTPLGATWRDLGKMPMF